MGWNSVCVCWIAFCGGADVVFVADVAAMAMTLEEVTEGVRYGNRSWILHGKTFVWERPFTKVDIKRFGDSLEAWLVCSPSRLTEKYLKP